MRVVCAWCQQEGLPALLYDREPLDDPTESHGICGRHRFELLAELSTGQAAAGGAASSRRGEAKAAEDACRALVRWTSCGREVLDHFLPQLLEGHSVLARRAAITERTSRSLEGLLATLRQDLAALDREHTRLLGIRRETRAVTEGLVSRLARDVVQPLADVVAKLGRMTVSAAESAPELAAPAPRSERAEPLDMEVERP